jgi:2-keto-4-pentenoate hydratase/2-oxohepta-3-ene-1,7-dioic acid hydratase in catechol pathway
MMINKPNEIIDEARTFLSFEDGDILMTGTPNGVGKFIHGDKFLGKIIFDNKTIIECNLKVI